MPRELGVEREMSVTDPISKFGTGTPPARR
jgi:hypothetical protein